MKFLIVFALALSTASAYRMANSKLGITNGKKAAAGQFPYQVGLSLDVEPLVSYWCGGSLIDNEWVLTAAHCMEGVKSVTVYLGATVYKTAEIKHTVSPSDIIHPGFDKSIFKHDICLIKIPKTAYTTNIKSVKLPAISSSYSKYVGDKVFVSGWGYISETVIGFTTDLQWGLIEIITNDACVDTFGYRITDSHICASTTGGVSPCHGDSGGPLVLESSKVQIGVNSFCHKGTCSKGFPVAITRVTSYLDWIKKHTGISY